MLRRKQINLITCAPASLTLPHMGHLGQLLGRDVPAYSVNWNQPFKVYHIFTHPTRDSPDVNAPLGDGVGTIWWPNVKVGAEIALFNILAI